MTNVNYVTVEQLTARIAATEDKYPDFANIWADRDIPDCCKQDEVAGRYGWQSPAVEAWMDYSADRYLRGDS